jgi:hypothetical protein
MLFLLTATCLALPAEAAPAAPTGTVLSGVVQDDKGRPVVGATVFVSTAAPRKGVGVL